MTKFLKFITYENGGMMLSADVFSAIIFDSATKLIVVNNETADITKTIEITGLGFDVALVDIINNALVELATSSYTDTIREITGEVNGVPNSAQLNKYRITNIAIV
tara:strand:+ start:244 stop:561 length:318 start_codon:yes stop_codon:yes gene_type:complete